MTVHLDLAAIDEMLNTPDGPVGVVIAELSDKAAAIARAAAPVLERGRFNPYYQYGPPGATKASVRSHFPAFSKIGQLYGGVNVLYGPTLFLERPAIQVTPKKYAFMSLALDLVAL